MPDHSRERRPGRRNGRRCSPPPRSRTGTASPAEHRGRLPSGIHSARSGRVDRPPRLLTGPPGLPIPPPSNTPSASRRRPKSTPSTRRFLADFAQVEAAYVESIVNGQTSTTTVTATVTAPYTLSLPPRSQVDNAAVFGANGVFATPINANASLGGIPLGATYVLTGRSGNTLTVNTATLEQFQPAGRDHAHGHGPEQEPDERRDDLPQLPHQPHPEMAISLVNYFNSLPLKLPYFNAPPRTRNQRGAIQNYVYNQVAGIGLTTPSLQQTLLAITLPTTSGPDLNIYNAVVALRHRAVARADPGRDRPGLRGASPDLGASAGQPTGDQRKHVERHLGNNRDDGKRLDDGLISVPPHAPPGLTAGWALGLATGWALGFGGAGLGLGLAWGPASGCG